MPPPGLVFFLERPAAGMGGFIATVVITTSQLHKNRGYPALSALDTPGDQTRENSSRTTF
ncbi:hypothetical protein CLE01_10070 [Cryobacterium levicorallinum]|nr:hypothetical protein CLE01_10070 [Cryobacterium levicorallinum]